MNRLIIARSVPLLLFRQGGRRIGRGHFQQFAPLQELALVARWRSGDKTNTSPPDDSPSLDDPPTSAEELLEGDDEDEVDEEEDLVEIDRSEVDEEKPGDEGPELMPTKEDMLETKVKELRDQLQRSLAEQENTRRIADLDVYQARQFAIKAFAKSLLEVSDNLERALNAVPADAIASKPDQGPSVLATLYQGIQLTEKELRKAFESNGLVKFGDIGEVFDPNKHEALYEYPDAQLANGTVGQVMKPGFMLNSRVLRPAEVGVVKN